MARAARGRTARSSIAKLANQRSLDLLRAYSLHRPRHAVRRQPRDRLVRRRARPGPDRPHHRRSPATSRRPTCPAASRCTARPTRSRSWPTRSTRCSPGSTTRSRANGGSSRRRSHELRNPLAVIRTNLDVALDDPDADPAEAAPRRRAGATHGDRACPGSSTTCWPTPAAARPIHELTEVDVAGGGRGRRRGLRGAGHGPAARGWRRPPSPVCGCDGDRGALRQAVANLLANAVRLAPSGSRIRIGAGRQDRWIWMVVDDEGPGIPAERARRSCSSGSGVAPRRAPGRRVAAASAWPSSSRSPGTTAAPSASPRPRRAARLHASGSLPPTRPRRRRHHPTEPRPSTERRRPRRVTRGVRERVPQGGHLECWSEHRFRRTGDAPASVGFTSAFTAGPYVPSRHAGGTMDPNRPDARWSNENAGTPPLRPGPWVPPSSTYGGQVAAPPTPNPARPPLAEPGSRPPLPPVGPPPGGEPDHGRHSAKPSRSSYVGRVLAGRAGRAARSRAARSPWVARTTAATAAERR